LQHPKVVQEVRRLPLELSGYVLDLGVDSVRESGKTVKWGLRGLLRR
jgi:hypothetical protein